VRRLLCGGGLAVAACAFWLLVSGAASARQTSDTITVAGTVNGTTVVFTVGGSPFKNIGLDGGSNNSITAISDPGASDATCNLTPTNNGGDCSFTNSHTSTTIQTTWSGPLPTVVFGGVSYADTTNGTFQAPVTGAAPVCDWAVQFLAPPTSAFRTPLAYSVKVTNNGTGECPEATLTTEGDITVPLSGGKASFKPATVPALAPGGKAIVGADLERVVVNDVGRDWAMGKGGVQLSVSTSMPVDADGGSDEGAGTNTHLTWQVALFNPESGAIGASCPSAGSGACGFHLDLFAAGTARASSEVAVARPLQVGSASGTVKKGKKGAIHYRLNTVGRRLLKKKHKLAVTLIGTRKQGSVTTLIRGHVRLH